MLWGYLWKQMRLPFEIFNLEQPSTFVQSLHQNEFGQSKCCPAKKRKTTAFVKNGIVSIPCSWIEAFQFHSIVLSIMSWHCLYMSRTHISQRNWLARPLLRNLGFEANPTLVCQKITNFFSSLVQQGIANIVSWRAMLWFICENNWVCLFVLKSFNLPEPSKFWFLSNLRTNVSFLERSRKKRQTQSATVWPGCRNHSPQIDLNFNSLIFIVLQYSD